MHSYIYPEFVVSNEKHNVKSVIKYNIHLSIVLYFFSQQIKVKHSYYKRFKDNITANTTKLQY